jgi:glutathione-regulated potassium-efflux system ancillary protein KefF
MICVIYAHPYPSRSRTNRALAEALRGSDHLDFRALYDLYPDFDIDVAAEQSALEQARLVVWMHPLFWYSVPALLKHWIDKVLAYGWAYGEGGAALHGKHCLWVPTTGGDERAYTPSGIHAHPFASFVPPIEQTARFCGMRWEPPHVVHDANATDEIRLAEHVARLRERLAPWRDPEAAPVPEAPPC